MTSTVPAAVIRQATPGDVTRILQLIRDLAGYERAASECVATEDDLLRTLFADGAAAFAHVAERGDEVVGVALWFLTYSTWTGRHGIHLEDLYVTPDARGAGVGRALLVTLAQICVARGYARLEWSVLDWNESAIGFYESLGAGPVTGWTRYRLAGESLNTVSASAVSVGAAADRGPGPASR